MCKSCWRETNYQPNHSKLQQLTQRANQNSTVTCNPKRGKQRACQSRLVSVLLLIGCESGARITFDTRLKTTPNEWNWMKLTFFSKLEAVLAFTRPFNCNLLQVQFHWFTYKVVIIIHKLCITRYECLSILNYFHYGIMLIIYKKLHWLLASRTLLVYAIKNNCTLFHPCTFTQPKKRKNNSGKKCAHFEHLA